MRLPSSLRASSSALLLGTVVAVGASISACGGTPPPPPPVTPAKPIAVVPEPPPDVSAVPEPAGLIVVARISRVDGIMRTLGTWTRLPLPNGTELVRSLTDDSVADAVDMAQPIDGAVALGGSKRDPKPLIAVSVAVRSFDDAKAKLSAKHKLTPRRNGQLFIEGVGRAAAGEKGRGKDKDDDEEEEACILSPASAGARLVCGEPDALDALAPYLTRTVPRQPWTSDIHMEVTLQAVREPLNQVRSMLPVLARSMLGSSSPALAALVDSGVNELVEFVGDTGRMSLDAQIADSGVTATMRADYNSTQSFMAKLATSKPERADVPPPAFWHLPGDSDIAGFGKGSDPKLFDHPRELIGNVALEATAGVGMPEAERKAVRELVVDRMLGLFTGPLVYAKGHDPVALDKAVAARRAVKPGDIGGADEANRVAFEQSLGWHLVQVSEPITKVGPVLKDWAGLWNRPAFAKWAKAQASEKMLAKMRIVPTPAGVTLPKDAVHLEIVMPRADIVEDTRPPAAPPPSMPRAGGKPGAPAAAPPGPPKPANVKRIPVKPFVLHIIAVPDQGGTWIGFGLDAKLLAQKAAAALSTAPDAASLAKSPNAEALRDVKANGAFFTTLRGLLAYTSFGGGAGNMMPMLAALPGKGTTPMVITYVAEAPSEKAKGGSAVATLKLPRGAIEDIVKMAMSR